MDKTNPPVRLLSGSLENSFAYLTIRDRWPVILVKAVDNLSQLMHSKTMLSNFNDQSITDIQLLIKLIGELTYG
jgi:hypothetical protein